MTTATTISNPNWQAHICRAMLVCVFMLGAPLRARRSYVKSMPKYRGNGCQSAGKRAKVIPRSVLGSWICTGRGLGFSLEAAPSWDADALFRMDKAGPRPSRDARETGLKENKILRRILYIMAKESYLLQGTIYSNRQTIVSYYNRNKIGQ